MHMPPLEAETAATWIQAIQYDVGVLHPIRSLTNYGVAATTIEGLEDKGIRSFASIAGALAPAIERCVRQIAHTTRVGLTDVDTVMLVTDSHEGLFEAPGGEHTDFRSTRERFLDFVQNIGLHRATVMTLGYGSCANVLHGLMVADALVRSGRSRCVLMILAERYPTVDARLRQGDSAIAADGVAVALLCASPGRGGLSFGIEQVNITPYDVDTAKADGGNVLLESFRAMKNAAADCYQACQRQPGDYRWVVMGDYNLKSSLMYAKFLGFPPERVFLNNVGLRGHIPFDPLIGLADLLTAGKCAPGDHVLMYVGGPVSGGVISLRAA